MSTMPERAPYEAYATDGSPNVGSYEFAGFVGYVTQARQILIGRGVDPQTLPPAAVRALAGVLQDTADRIQHRLRAEVLTTHRLAQAAEQAARNDETLTEEQISAIRTKTWEQNLVDRQGGSHTRARSCMYTAIEDFPLPAGQLNGDTLTGWVDRIEGRAFGLLRIAAGLAYTDRSQETREDRIAALADQLTPSAAVQEVAS